MKRFLIALTIIAFILDFTSSELVITIGKGYESNQLYYFLGVNSFWLLFFIANSVILIYYAVIRDQTFNTPKYGKISAFIMDITILCFALFRLLSSFNNFNILI